MKIKLKNLFLLLMILCFFVPDGISTVGEPKGFIINASFLKHQYIFLLMKFLYWGRNGIGILFSLDYLINRMYGLVRNEFKIRIETLDLLFLFFLWVLISSHHNGIGIYEVFIQVSFCFGWFVIVKKYCENDQEFFLRTISSIICIFLVINATMILMYPDGITTGTDYLATPYYLLGTKNQTTPLLILCLMLGDINYRINKNKLKLIFNMILSIVNVFLMGSATGVVCIVLYILLDVMFILGKTKNKANGNTIFKGIIALAIISEVGVVFEDIQKYVGWLIVGILEKDITFSGRTYIWKEAIRKFLSNPIYGWGYGTKVQLNLYAHNLVIELLYTVGIIGFVLFAFFVLKVINGEEIKNCGCFSLPLLCSIIVLILANMVEAFIYNIPQITMLALMSYLNSGPICKGDNKG